MGKEKVKEVKWVLDLNEHSCHVCGCHLVSELATETEKCGNQKCQIYNLSFNMPYVAVPK